MDYTLGTEQFKIDRAKKMMLWFGIISLTMTFAALISAYIVSKERSDWLVDFDFPMAFVYSTVVLLVSSVLLHVAKAQIVAHKNKLGLILLLATLALGIVFMMLQIEGFGAFIDQGYYLTGASSNVTTTFMFVIIGLHILHIMAGFIVLLTLIVQTLRNKYSSTHHVGLDIGVTFWHFLDVLWVMLFLFLFFVR